MSKDLKAVKRVREDQRSWLMGVVALSGVVGFFGGRAISRQFVAPQRAISRSVVRALATGAVFTGSFGVYPMQLFLMTDWDGGAYSLWTAQASSTS